METAAGAEPDRLARAWVGDVHCVEAEIRGRAGGEAGQEVLVRGDDRAVAIEQIALTDLPAVRTAVEGAAGAEPSGQFARGRVVEQRQAIEPLAEGHEPPLGLKRLENLVVAGVQFARTAEHLVGGHEMQAVLVVERVGVGTEQDIGPSRDQPCMGDASQPR